MRNFVENQMKSIQKQFDEFSTDTTTKIFKVQDLTKKLETKFDERAGFTARIIDSVKKETNQNNKQVQENCRELWIIQNYVDKILPANNAQLMLRLLRPLCTTEEQFKSLPSVGEICNPQDIMIIQEKYEDLFKELLAEYISGGQKNCKDSTEDADLQQKQLLKTI